MEYANESPEYLIIHQAYFMEKFGFNILELNKRKMNKIAKIMERGKIKTDNEFRLLNGYVDELCQTSGAPDLIDQLNKLLLDYEEQAATKRKNC